MGGRSQHRPEFAAEEVAARFKHAHRLETVGRLTEAIAHRLNNLMTVVVGYGQYLLDRPTASQAGQAPVQELELAVRGRYAYPAAPLAKSFPTDRALSPGPQRSRY